MSKKAIIFDLDGTLWQVIDETILSANKVAEKYNLNKISKQTVLNVFGKNRLDASKLYFPTLKTDEALKYTEELEHVNNEYLLKFGGTLYSGVEETITHLSKFYDLYIVSNTAEKKYIEAFLFSSKLNNYFSGFIASGNVFKNLDSTKAKAEAILKIISENNINSAVYVGDTEIDKKSSQIANIPFIWAEYGFGKNISSKYKISNFYEIEDVIKKIF